MRTALLLGVDLARITGEVLADGVVWAAVNAANLARRHDWFRGWLN